MAEVEGQKDAATAASSLVDAKGRPLASTSKLAEDETEKKSPRTGIPRWLKGGSFVGLLTALVAGGSLFLEYRTSDAERDTAEAEEAVAIAENTPSFEVIYWIGPMADELILTPDPYALMPEEFAGSGIVESPGEWLVPSNLELERSDITCTSSACEEISNSDLLELRRTLWLLLVNTSDRTMQSIAIDWEVVDTEPIELSGPFESVRRDAEGDTEPDDGETLIDLRPGDSVLLPMGTVVRLSPLGGIRAIPIGQARIPLTLSYDIAGDETRNEVAIRVPSETVVSGGYDSTGTERVGMGG